MDATHLMEHCGQSMSSYNSMFSFIDSWLFFAGVFIQRYKERMLGHLIKFWWVYFTLYVINVSVGMDIYVMKYPMIRCLLLTLFMIGFAYRYPMIHVGKDVSYGVYIYHMIFVNIAIALGYTRSWMAFGIVMGGRLFLDYICGRI